MHNKDQKIALEMLQYTPGFTEIKIPVSQLLFQKTALVFIKSTRYYNLYFLSLYS
jgi:hypothetical protein